MSGYNYNNNWRRRGRDSVPQGGRGGQNPGYWNNSHYGTYQNYNQYQYPQTSYQQQQQWNSTAWTNQNQYGGSYGREAITHNQGPRHSFNPNQGHVKPLGHASTIRSQTPPSDSRYRPNQEQRSSYTNQSPTRQKTSSPPLGSEEARKKSLAQATDKIKSCLLSFQNEKSEVLENLLSTGEEQKKDDSDDVCAKPKRIEKPGYAPELQLTSSDLKVIGMVNTSATESMEQTANYAVERVSANEFLDPSARASSQSSDCSGKGAVRNDVLRGCDEDMLGTAERGNLSGSLYGETHSPTVAGPLSHSSSKRSKYLSESNNPGHFVSTHGKDNTLNPTACIQPRSASMSTSNDTDLSKAGTGKTTHEHTSQTNQNEPSNTLKHLKQRIIQQFLKMGKNNLKDVINNPRSRKFEFAMNHLMKEHRMLLSRELRGLAQSRIKGQELEILEQNDEPIKSEISSLPDTDFTINLSHLPQEVIEQLGSFLQLDLLDTAGSADFQSPITVEDESNVHNLQNIQALQVALLSEGNIKREILETELNSRLGEELSENTLGGSLNEKSMTGDFSQTETQFPLDRPESITEREQDEIHMARQEENAQALVFEEGGAIKKGRKESGKWPAYVPLGKGFMNRSGEFGSLFNEFSDLLGMESENINEQSAENTSPVHLPNVGTVEPSFSGSDLMPTRPSEEIMSSKSVSQTLNRLTEDMEQNLPAVNNETVGHNYTVNDIPAEKFVIKSSISSIVTSEPDTGVKCDSHIGNTNGERSDNSVHNSNNENSSLHASRMLPVNPFEELQCSGDASKSENPAYADNAFESFGGDAHLSQNSDKLIQGTEDGDESLETSSVADKLLQDSSVAAKQLDSSVEVTKLMEDHVVTKEIVKDPTDATKPLEVTADANKLLDLAVTGFEVSEAKDSARLKDAKKRSCVYDESNTCRDQSDRSCKNFNNNPDLKENINPILNASSIESTLSEDHGNNSTETEGAALHKEADQNYKTAEGGSGNTAAVDDVPDEAVDINPALASRGMENVSRNTEDGNCDSTTKTGVSNDKVSAEENEPEDITIDELYGDLSDFSNTEDVDNSAVYKTEDEIPPDDAMEPSGLSIDEPEDVEDTNKSSGCSESVPEEQHSNANKKPQESQVSSKETPNSSTTGEEVEIHHCNVVVKTEEETTIPDLRMEETQQEMHSEMDNVQQESAVVPTSVLQTPVVEISTQTDPPDELDSNEIQRMLQLLEKSSQLSPQLAKLLRDHFSSTRLMDEDGSTKLSTSVGKDSMSVSKDKDSISLIRVSECSNINETPLSIHPLLSYRADGMGTSFRAPTIAGNKGKKIYPKKTHTLMKSSKPEEIRETNVMESGGQNRDSENTGIESNGGVTISTDINGVLNSNSASNIRRDTQEVSIVPNTKYIFFKMLEIDKEIQKMMEIKLDLYKKLQINLEMDSPCPNRNGVLSTKCTNPTTSKEVNDSAIPSQALSSKVVMRSNSSSQEMRIDCNVVNNKEITSNSFASDKPVPTLTPMVVLPADFVLDSSSHLQNTQSHSSLPRHKLNERLKPFDTSVVEAVLNSFDIPDCQNKEATEADNGVQNRGSNESAERSPLQSKLDHLDANKGRRSGSPRLSTSYRESHVAQGNTSPRKTSSPKKQIQKSKPSISKSNQAVIQEHHSLTQTHTRVATRNKLTPVDNQQKTQVQTSIRRSIRPDASRQTVVKELRNRRQTENKQQEIVTSTRSTRQKSGDKKQDDDSSQSDCSSISDVQLSARLKLKEKSFKRTENESSPSRPIRHSQNKPDMSKCSESGSLQKKERRDTKSKGIKNIESGLDDAVHVGNKKETRSSKTRYSTSLDELETSEDNTGRNTRKRKVSAKVEVTSNDQSSASSQEESIKPSPLTRSRRSSTKTDQDVQQAVTDENERKKRRTGKDDSMSQALEQVSAVSESTIATRRLKRTLPSNFEQSEINENQKPKTFSEETSGQHTRRETRPDPKNRRLSSGSQKRRVEETDEPPSKIQRLEPKPDLLQWNLQDCFVMVKPLPVEQTDDSNPPNDNILECSVSDKSKKERNQEQRSVESSDEVPVKKCVKNSRRTDLKKSSGVKDTSSKVDECYRLDSADPDQQLDPMESEESTAEVPVKKCVKNSRRRTDLKKSSGVKDTSSNVDECYRLDFADPNQQLDPMEGEESSAEVPVKKCVKNSRRRTDLKKSSGVKDTSSKVDECYRLDFADPNQQLDPMEGEESSAEVPVKKCVKNSRRRTDLKKSSGVKDTSSKIDECYRLDFADPNQQLDQMEGEESSAEVPMEKCVKNSRRRTDLKKSSGVKDTSSKVDECYRLDFTDPDQQLDPMEGEESSAEVPVEKCVKKSRRRTDLKKSSGVKDTSSKVDECYRLDFADPDQQLDPMESEESSVEVPVKKCVKNSRRRTDLKKSSGVKDTSSNVDECYRLDFADPDQQLDPMEGTESQQDPLGGIPDLPNCQTQPPELHIEPYGNITSSPLQLPPDLLVQSNSPGRLRGHCILPEVAMQDENSISTLVSDTISVMSDGEQSLAKKTKSDEKAETDLLTHGTDSKDDCDRDSSYSYDMTQEGREGTSSRASKHKASRKHKKGKSETIERLVFEAHEGSILDIKTVGRHVLAASEDGSVYCYSLKSGKFKRKYEGHKAAVTCLCVIECSNNSGSSSELDSADGEQIDPDLFFTGSLDKHLRYFRFKTGELVQNPIDIGSPIQCMDQYLGVLYIGTKSGEVARFNIKTSALVGETLKIGRDAVLTLKATKEGPRQVLIIGTRNRPIAVRDAATGLLLRTVCNNWSHTVYSLVLGTSIVYCGTKSGRIPAVEFTSGNEVCRFQAGAGVVCMRLYNNLLFAGCYDGNIYVFSTQDQTQVSCITGPGKMLLSMDIVKNRIIAGSKDSNKLEAWGFPQEIRNHLKEAKHR